jgi:hypothetical protein
MFAFQIEQCLLFKQGNICFSSTPIFCFFWRTTQTQFTKRIEWLQPNSKNMKHEASGTLCPERTVFDVQDSTRIVYALFSNTSVQVFVFLCDLLHSKIPLFISLHTSQKRC